MDTNVITKDTKGSKDILGTAQHFDASDNHLELSKAARKFKKRNDRAPARKLRCHVAVSKLDRLSRDVHFISGLMAPRCPFSSPNWGLTLTHSCSTCLPRWRRRNARSYPHAHGRRSRPPRPVG